MENNLTIIKPPTRIESAGETETSSAEEQLARDNQPKATNCRWGGSFSSAIPFYDSQRQFRALLCLKKPPCRRQGCLLTVKVICPIHAEPVHNHLRSLPPEIGNLIHLKSLDLSNNQLGSLPADIGELANLKYLSLSNNQLNQLPKEIGHLSHLAKIYLTNNPLDAATCSYVLPLLKENNPNIQLIYTPKQPAKN